MIRTNAMQKLIIAASPFLCFIWWTVMSISTDELCVRDSFLSFICVWTSSLILQYTDSAGTIQNTSVTGIYTHRSTPSSISFWGRKWKKQKHRGRRRLVRLRERIMSSSAFNNPPFFPSFQKACGRIPGLSFVRRRSDCQADYLFLYGLYLLPALLHRLRNHYFTQKQPLVDVIKSSY